MNYFDELEGASPPHLQTELLFDLLCDDERRPKLYAGLRQAAPIFPFNSRARRAEDVSETEFHQTAYLLTCRKDIKRALRDFSNSSYKPIGTGTFVLGLDNGAGHEAKREFLLQALQGAGSDGRATLESEINHLAILATHHALVAPTRSATFDLVTEVAEQAALRFVSAFFGLPDQYHPIIQDRMRRTYTTMIFQMFARHFVTDSQLLDDGKVAMFELAKLVAGVGKDTDSVALAADLTPIIATHPQAAVDFFRSLTRSARAVKALHPALDAYEAGLRDPGLAGRTAALLDKLLDYPPIRAATTELLTNIPDGHNGDDSLRVELQALIAAFIARKQLRDEQLVPRLFDRRPDGRLAPVSPTTTAATLYSRESIIEKMVRAGNARSLTEIAVAVVGSIAGLVGNVIAGSCIAIDRFFRLNEQDRTRIHALIERVDTFDEAGINLRIKSAAALLPFIKESLRLQPPAAFIPRRTVRDERFDDFTIPAGSEVIVPIGAATRDLSMEQAPDEFDDTRQPDDAVDIFGLADTGPRSHRCIGEFIALPLIAHIVRGVLALPGLAQQMQNGRPLPLQKKWGYICESFPLQYSRLEALAQNPLNVVMKIRSPTAEHAAALKLILQSAAPSIERLLAASKMVHFARFILLSGETELGLFTVFDGDTRPYLEYFAKVAGPLFDKIFEHIEPRPPMPIRQHQEEFVQHIQRFNIPSAANYFFSAHPRRKVTG